MTRAYKNGQPQPICEAIGNIFCDANCDKAELIKKLKVQVTLIHLQALMMNYFENPAGPVNATEFMAEIFKAVKKEIGLTKDKD